MFSDSEQNMQKVVNEKKQRDARKNEKRDQRLLSAMVVHFRDEIASRNIKSDPTCHRQGVSHGDAKRVSERHVRQNADQRGQSDQISGDKRLFPAFTSREHEGSGSETFRKFVKENGNKDQNAAFEIYLRGRCDRY